MAAAIAPPQPDILYSISFIAAVFFPIFNANYIHVLHIRTHIN